MFVKDFLERLLHLLFPPRCPFCRGFLAYGVCLCDKCKDTLPYVKPEELFTKGNYFTKALAPFSYEGAVRDALHAYKFEGKSMYAPYFAEILAESIAENLENCYDVISYIPISKQRKGKRGYDQGELLAKACAKRLNMPLYCTLKKVVHTKAQSSLGGLDLRAGNIKDAYEVIEKATIEGKRILLVDDICTTGATFSEASKCLLKAGVEEVLCVSVAKTLKNRV